MTYFTGFLDITDFYSDQRTAQIILPLGIEIHLKAFGSGINDEDRFGEEIVDRDIRQLAIRLRIEKISNSIDPYITALLLSGLGIITIYCIVFVSHWINSADFRLIFSRNGISRIR